MPLDLQTWFVICFYAILVLLIIIFRKKFEFQAKFIALLKTKLGLKLMDSISKKHPKLVRGLGYVGIWFGYIGMAVMTYFIFYGLYMLVAKPEAPATVAPVIPGVQIPGSPVFVPFFYGIIAIFVVAAIHEFAHGVVARAHKIKVKSSGIVFFGPIIGAFVEPDEKKLKKEKPIVQNSVFAAGPFSNIILSAIILLLMTFVFQPATDALVDAKGVYFSEIQDGFPAKLAGLQNGTTYTFVNNQTINSSTGFIAALEGLKPNDTVVIGNENTSVTIIAVANPNDPESGYIGVMGIYTKFVLKNPDNMPLYILLDWFYTLFFWIFVFSLGIGLFNLLPWGALDGGRMFLIALRRKFDEKKAQAIFTKVTILFIIFIILLFVPIIKAIGQSLVGWLT